MTTFVEENTACTNQIGDNIVYITRSIRCPQDIKGSRERFLDA